MYRQLTCYESTRLGEVNPQFFCDASTIGTVPRDCPIPTSLTRDHEPLGQTRKPENSLLAKVMTSYNLHSKTPFN
jgi:hypothetical protein